MGETQDSKGSQGEAIAEVGQRPRPEWFARSGDLVRHFPFLGPQITGLREDSMKGYREALFKMFGAQQVLNSCI